MSRRAAGVLLAAAAWTLFVWLTRINNVLGDDRSTSFKVVHLVLAGVSVVLGVAVGWIGLRAWLDRRV
ncbi:MAG: SCO4848 family membrane protein [Acidimicrobiia bacterium]